MALEVALVLPVVLAVTVGLVVLEVALVDVAVYELLHSLAVLKAIEELSLVSVSVFVY